METATLLNTPPLMFMDKHSLAIRIWHWLTFIVLAASLVMVLLASTMFSTKGNISMVTEQVENKGGSVTAVQARAVAHEYSDKLWMMHKYIGYGLCFLLLCRMVIEIAGPQQEKLAVKIKNALRLRKSTPGKNTGSHFLFVKDGYVFFYAIFLVMAITGLGLAFEDVPLLHSIHKPLIKVHEFTQYLMYLYIIVHIVGVIRADTTDSKGIVSGMIHG